MLDVKLLLLDLKRNVLAEKREGIVVAVIFSGTLSGHGRNNSAVAVVVGQTAFRFDSVSERIVHRRRKHRFREGTG